MNETATDVFFCFVLGFLLFLFVCFCGFFVVFFLFLNVKISIEEGEELRDLLCFRGAKNLRRITFMERQ